MSTESKCRRCSECPTSSHHWMLYEVYPEDEEEGEEFNAEAEFSCKHCPAIGIQCDECDGFGTLDGMEPDEDSENCPKCNGEGVLELKQPASGEGE